ncbi:MAG: ubiquitin-conjugating enzyme E2 [Chloroflexota bacterium]
MAAPDPVGDRLRSEHARLQAWCAERPHAARLLSVEGNPPRKYRLEFQCDSVARLSPDGQPVMADRQAMEILIPTGFPMQAPVISVVTPVVHPNIWGSGQVCLGHYWSTQRTLDQLAAQLWRILVWDPEVTNPDSPANGAAATWYRNRAGHRPFDRLDPAEPKRAAPAPAATPEAAPKPRIVWNNGD